MFLHENIYSLFTLTFIQLADTFSDTCGQVHRAEEKIIRDHCENS